MKVRVVLVGCEYDENLGLVARAMKNFGLTDLALVKPEADKSSDKAISRAMHAKETLKKAKSFGSLEDALKGMDFAVATTARSSKNAGSGRKAISPELLAEKYRDSGAKIAIVFGRESNGLTNSEIEKCDFIVSIPASKAYPVLNLSHAAVLVFYELFREKPKTLFNVAGKETKSAVTMLFADLADATGRIRNKKAVVGAFRHLLARAPATDKEVRAVAAVLSESLKKITPKKQKREH
ncbi:MAG: RNA methyltransferase [Candidatus Diapherotrites archaeon]|nr:RNA methyltransferase [Candidatus Diapherotrites archaeon]